MAKEIKKKSSFGTVNFSRVSPPLADNRPKGINVVLSLEEALKLRLSLDQICLHLNAYNRNYKDGKNAGVNLCLFPFDKAITITEGRIE